MPQFTVKSINALKPQDKPYQVREGKGFGVRVFPSGEKTWFFAYKIYGRQRLMTLGDISTLKLADAREKFREARDLLKKGIDPLELKVEESQEPTVAILIDEFLERHAKKNASRSYDEYKRNLEKDVLPIWGRRRAKDIKKRDIIALLDTIVDRGSDNQANQVFKIIRTMFNFAVDRDILEYSPCLGVKLPSPIVKKNRYFSDDEIKTFWNEIEHVAMSKSIREALRLILVTGQRPGEVIGIHPDEIDGDWWTIPETRTKNKREHRVFLTPLAKEILGEFEGFRFPSPKKKKGAPIQVNALAKAVRRCSSWDSTEELDEPTNKRKPLFTIEKPWTPHDLRRTLATGLGRIGYMDEMIGLVLNHTRSGVTAIYNRHRYDNEKRRALEAWSIKVKNILKDDEQNNLIPFTPKAR